MNKESQDLRIFLDNSNLELALPGMYSTSNSVVVKAFDHFLDTGEHVLLEHTRLEHLKWAVDNWVEFGTEAHFNRSLPDKTEFNLLFDCYLDETFWHWSNWFSSPCIIMNYMKAMNKHSAKVASYKERRRVASSHITRKSVRERIFLRDKSNCKNCATSSKLSIDHIIPVIKGGGNEDSNLQVLCITCNISKGGR